LSSSSSSSYSSSEAKRALFERDAQEKKDPIKILKEFDNIVGGLKKMRKKNSDHHHKLV
jgi:hypothetical protein